MAQDQESLRDLDGVRVSVQPIPPTASSAGLSAERVKESVESSLRAAGIRVLSTGDFPTGDPFLRVAIETTEEIRGSVAFGVQVDFVQMVFMRRNPAVTFNRAQTWRAASALGLVERAGLVAAVAREVDAQVAQFVEAYRSVNGR